MDPVHRPSDTELVRLLDEEREAVERPVGPAGSPPEGTTGRVEGRDRKRFEGALPLEDFLREIDDRG